MSMPSCQSDRPLQLALVLGGGGARAAYQVGVLRAIARRCPQLRIPLLTGVSAGAINIALLANHTGAFTDKVEALTQLWRKLRIENVFTVSGAALLWRALRIGLRLSIGLPSQALKVHGMVDTNPLRAYLRDALGTKDGCLPEIDRNIEEDRLEAVALTTLSYGTGNTVTFCRGREIETWERPRRRSVHTPLTVEHIMASAALPLFFPSIRIGNDWYGDGGIRLVAPLGPAVHLGADRILAISPHYMGQGEIELSDAPPSPAVVLSALYDAIFLDQLDQDVLQMQRINQLVAELPKEKRLGMRDVKLCVIRPSRDLGELAFDLKHHLPPVLRYLLGRFGTSQVRSDDFMSAILFHEVYIERLLEIGERDGEARGDELQAFLTE